MSKQGPSLTGERRLGGRVWEPAVLTCCTSSPAGGRWRGLFPSKVARPHQEDLRQQQGPWT